MKETIVMAKPKVLISDELSPRLGITWSLFDGHA